MPDQRPNRRRQPQSTPEQDFVEGLFKGIGQIISFIFKLGKPGTSKQDRQARFSQVREHWQDVELHLLQPQTAGLAVSEADKLLDAGFQALGIAGQTMGERLKASEKWFSHELYQRVWDAHKLRNQLAHEVGASAHPEDAKQAVAAFRDALYQLNILQ